MKDSPTLADAVIRESLRPRSYLVPAKIGEQVAQARKFVLDADASRFLSDLSHASFYQHTAAANAAKIDQTRELARLPHASTWIEYDPRAFRMRTSEQYKSVPHVSGETVNGMAIGYADDSIPLDEVTPRIGWLLMAVPPRDDTFAMFVFADFTSGVAVLPFTFGWSTDDATAQGFFPADADVGDQAYLATGIKGYRTPHVTVSRLPGRNKVDASIMMEFMGELRHAWSLLAAINDVPFGIKHVTPAKGFVARGRYRKFFTHSIISLNLPKGRDPQKVARQVVEISRRRAHLVRGHWRRDWRHEGNKIWVHEHTRGDVSLGFVLHDYDVKHEDGNAETALQTNK